MGLWARADRSLTFSSSLPFFTTTTIRARISMEWEPKQEDLGGLGLSGICGELHRVVFRSIIGYSVDAAFPSALLLAHVATLRGLCSLIDADHIGAWWVALFLLEGVWMIVLPSLSLVWTAIYVFRVASLYCTQGDFRASLQRHLPHLPFTRFIPTYLLALALTSATLFLSLAALLLLHHYEVGLPLQLLAAAAFLAGTAYVAVVCYLACVVPMLEDAVKFAALRKSHALLGGKFWPAAAVFVTLDGCFVALQLAFARLVLDDALGLGLGFQLAAGVTVFMALWAVVIYMVCKNHHHEVVDKVHLDYIGEYERLAVDGDNGVELQPVTTERIPETTA
uniref:Transmembrane protein n=1 Tax=Aegilops tauschii TaxID=37682 RepID=M8C7A1_AEGTA